MGEWRFCAVHNSDLDAGRPLVELPRATGAYLGPHTAVGVRSSTIANVSTAQSNHRSPITTRKPAPCSH